MKMQWKLVRFMLWLVLSLIVARETLAQENMCVIADTRFACPDYFEALKEPDNVTRIFKYTGSGNDLYFFVTIPSSKFDPAQMGEVLRGYYPEAAGVQFEWKPVRKPLLMSTDTKYKYDVHASMGLGPNNLFEVKSFVFQLDGKQVVFGYISDWSQDPTTNRSRFEKGVGFGDNAAGCNAVVTTLNSITKEFNEPKQYCFLSALAAPAPK